MHGARRVVVFCLLIAVLPTSLLIVSLYLRHSVFADVTYAVAESDVLEVVDGISTVFCQEQMLSMNTTFHAFQLKNVPKVSHTKKHIHLKKSMVLPDDTLEYWGFFLLRGSQVTIQTCARREGARVLMVEGEKNLRTCGLMQHVKYPHNPSHTVVGHGIHRPPVTVTPEPQLTEKDEFEGENVDEYDSDAALNTSTRIEDVVETEVKLLQEKALTLIKKHLNHNDESSAVNASQQRKVRHAKRRLFVMDNVHDGKVKDSEWMLRRATLQETLTGNMETSHHSPKVNTRRKRDIKPGIMLDGGVGHGGNAGNFSDVLEEESSESSFELNLLSCYEDKDLFTLDISPSHLCSSDSVDNAYMYNVTTDGYYYFIFYSDNDFYQNLIYAVFDIYKTTYEFTNYTIGCINKTECKFPISFWSDDIVIAEIPTRDGIEHEDADMTFLVSSCYPRMSVYIIFPVTVLFLVLGCAFV